MRWANEIKKRWANEIKKIGGQIKTKMRWAKNNEVIKK